MIVTLKPVTYNVDDAKELLKYRMLGKYEDVRDNLIDLEEYQMFGECGDIMEIIAEAYNFKFVDKEFMDMVIKQKSPLGKFMCVTPNEIACCDNSSGDAYFYSFDTFKDGICWLKRNKLRGGDTTTEFSKANQIIKFTGIILSANCHSKYFKHSFELATICNRLEEIRKDIERGD